jgi:branched-chain amino acid transport system ATP-binding protein
MPDAANGTLLSVRGLNAWYGESHVLHGVDFEVRRGEVVTLLGRNGVGKTTTLKSIMGMVSRRQGAVAFQGTETIRLPSNRIARLGIAFCPEERGIFASLNVVENLLLPLKFGRAPSASSRSTRSFRICASAAAARARSSRAVSSRCSRSAAY